MNQRYTIIMVIPNFGYTIFNNSERFFKMFKELQNSTIFEAMKDFLLFIFCPLLSEYKWFRKQYGGTWYRVYDNSSESGIVPAVDYWSHHIPEDESLIVEEERY